ncbi:hypothetical protein MTP99_002995 [Tenebrio molitor]|jgi:hypothetical protein|nr:hypothetical protein MTP99_002995 [Tenebrio molitor]
MGKKYVRTTTRASWTEAAMATTMEKVKNGELGINAASKEYETPPRTLRRHLIANNATKDLGRCSTLGREHERRLVSHIYKHLRIYSIADVKNMAFQFGQKMGLKHSFSEKNKSPGKVWLSLARAQGMNRKEVGDYFSLLLQVLTENDLLEHPSKIFYIDETGIQINNKPEQVIATKGSKDVYSLTSTENGENVSVIACCSAEGNFFPPVLIMKGKYKKPEFSERLPPGSDVYMNQKTSYINTDFFMRWFREYFIPRKGTGKALLVLDGHASHSNAIELLDFASQNEVVLLCLSSHTTQALQPLDKSFFKRLKSYFSQETKTWMIIHKDRKLNTRNVAALIGNAWSRAATVSNGVARFKAAGTYPYDPSVIPEHLFAISDASGASGGDVIQPTQGTTSGHTLVSSEHVSPKKN